MPQGSKRGRAEDEEDVDVIELQTYLKKEESSLRTGAKAVLNKELIARIEATKSLEERICEHASFAKALDAGDVKECRAELTACFRVGVRLESWLNTYTPPLSAGGNVGVSAEVQEGIYSNVHHLTQCCSDGLNRMLTFEKEHALMRTKCTDDAVWERYKGVLEDNQMHDLCKSIMSLCSVLLMVGNSICSNLTHLRTDIKEESVSTMY